LSNNIQLKKSLLFIPDISGFTKFVNQTGIVHGSHIIAELLEIIINNNILNLELAEIEGDAVFFYKDGEKPSTKAIFEQCVKMFTAFHSHLKLYDRDRICNCGACSNTSNLTLKFIVHYGDVIERNILGHLKLMGAEVTTAHKLMKNNIAQHEYLLISEKAFDINSNKDLPKWFSWNNDFNQYRDLGEVKYYFGYLTKLLNELPELPQRKPLYISKHPLCFNIDLRCKIGTAYDLLTNIERKPEWIVGLKKILFNTNKVPRIGTNYECILPLNTLKFETVKNDVTEKEIIYAEMAEDSGIYPAFSQIFTLTQTNENTCHLKIEIHHKSKFIKKFIFEKAMQNSINKSLINFKNICEKV